MTWRGTYQKRSFDQYTVSNALGILGKLGFEELSADSLNKLNKGDEFEEEIIIMAEVSAYCRIAQKVDYPLFVLSH